MCVGRPRDCSKSVRRVNSELLFDVVVEPVVAAAVAAPAVFDVERVAAEEAADETAPVFAESKPGVVEDVPGLPDGGSFFLPPPLS